MGNDKPAPLVPKEVDLRDFPRTPIVRGRLFGSTFHAEANDSEWRAGMTLWLKSWEQSPAGTLPAEDVTLARLAELARDVKTWKKLRPRALHGWFEADDGRLYHKVVAEVVLEAWLEKLAMQLLAAAGNAKRWKIEFDATPIEEAIERARAALRKLNPQSKALRKRRPGKQAGGPEPDDDPDGSAEEPLQDHPAGNPAGNPVRNPAGNASGSPVGIAIEVKRSKAKLSDLENRDSGVTQPPTPEPAAGVSARGAVLNVANFKIKGAPGQNWQSEVWVNATAQNLGITRRPGESFADFKDRTYEAVRDRRRA